MQKNKVPEGEIHVAVNAMSKGCHILQYQVHASKQVHARSKGLTKPTGCHILLYQENASKAKCTCATKVTDIKHCHYLLHCHKRIEGKAHEQYTAPSRAHSKGRKLQCTCTWHHLCLQWNPVDLIFPWVVHSPFASYLHVLWWRTTTCTNRGKKTDVKKQNKTKKKQCNKSSLTKQKESCKFHKTWTASLLKSLKIWLFDHFDTINEVFKITFLRKS